MDPVDRFYEALKRKDRELLRGCIHPDFEMIVPQKPARGFKSGEQEVKNIEYLFETQPEFVVTVLRKVIDGDEVWTESHLEAPELEMAAVTIWKVDRATDTLIGGRYYSEPVQRDAPGIDEFMQSLGGEGR